MPDVESINGVAAASVEAVNGVAKANIEALNGTSVPAAATGATRWVVGIHNGFVAYANNSDLSSWTSYSSTDHSNTAYDIGFGKDNSGNGVYIVTRNHDDRELEVSGTDVTDASTNWTEVDLSSDLTGVRQQYVIMWGARSDGTAAGTWVSAGKQSGQRIHRSTDGGANWENIDLSGIANHDAARGIQSMASDGQGNWAFAQENRWYYSTTDAASFSATTPITSNVPGQSRGVVFTNNTWVWIYSRSSQIYVRTCAASDITDWSDEFRPSLTYNRATADGSGTPTDTVYALNPSNTNEQRASVCAANGRVCFTTTNDQEIFYFDVDGKTISNANGKKFSVHGGGHAYAGVTNFDPADTMQDIATDGTTWIVVCKDGDAFKSTDNAVTWSSIVTGFDGGDVAASDDWKAITCDVVLPL